MAFQIFIVEDYDTLRRAYTLFLQRESDLVVCGAVASGEEALTLIPQQQPDLVLVDIFLPGMDGLTLITHLYHTQPALPIVIVTSREYLDTSNRHSPARLASVKGYLRKPEVPHRLIVMIRQVLGS
jgi:CheY-like chemotaxis protein